MSDTHRDTNAMLRAVNLSQPIDAVLHCGDETADAAWLTEQINVPVHAVRGNWDRSAAAYPHEAVVTNFGPRIWLTHGHRLQVKDGFDLLLHRARQVNADIVAFGHTHVPLVQIQNERLLLNPGSLSQPRGKLGPTFILLDFAPVNCAAGWSILASLRRLSDGSVTGPEVSLIVPADLSRRLP